MSTPERDFSFQEAAFFFFFFGLGEFPERHVFARVSRIDQIGAGPLARSVIEFDTVTADAGDQAADWIKSAAPEHDADFGLLRLTTTPSKFAKFANDIVDVQPGFWFHLELNPDQSAEGMRAWFAGSTPLGFTAFSKGRVVKGERLVSSIDPAPRPASLGAASVPALALPSAIAAVCRIPQRLSRLSAQDVLTRVPQADKVLVHDVGQGSFTTLLREGQPCLHFDVGAPTAFNAKGARSVPFTVDLDARVPIVLSHWDWDHFHAAFQFQSLRRCRWIVPDQILGPGAARLARGLADARRLYVWSGGSSSYNVGDLGECTGLGRNGTGLAMRASLLDGRSILLAGDADYNSLPFGTLQFDGLVATHHGGRAHSAFSMPPTPIGRSSYVISYGASNVYRHPHDEALTLHSNVGWADPVRTASFDGIARGDRVL